MSDQFDNFFRTRHDNDERERALNLKRSQLFEEGQRRLCAAVKEFSARASRSMPLQQVREIQVTSKDAWWNGRKYNVHEVGPVIYGWWFFVTNDQFIRSDGVMLRGQHGRVPIPAPASLKWATDLAISDSYPQYCNVHLRPDDRPHIGLIEALVQVLERGKPIDLLPGERNARQGMRNDPTVRSSDLGCSCRSASDY